MPELSKAARKAMPFWPIIEAGAREGLSTHDIWESIREYADEIGYESPGVSAAGVSALRGLASRIVRSGREFERATDDQGLHAGMIAEAPWARSLGEQNALGIYQVRFLHGTVVNGEFQQNWRTSVFQGQLPATVGELHAAIARDAEELSREYNVGHVDFGSVQIMRV